LDGDSSIRENLLRQIPDPFRSVITINRREVVLQLSGLITSILVLPLPNAIAAEVGGDEDFDTSIRNNELIWSSEESFEQPPVYINNEFSQSPEIANDTLGSPYRAPGSSLVKLDTMQASGANAPQDAPKATAVSPGAYFSDDLHKSFWSESESPLSSAPSKIRGGDSVGATYHLFARPTELPPGESIEANLRRVVPERGSVSAAGTRDAVNLMRNSGAWNYKDTFGRSWKDAGDFNFGVISAALEVPEWFALLFAGWYAEYHGTHIDEWGHWYNWSGSLGHDPHAQEKIKEGYEYYRNKELVDMLYNQPPENHYHLGEPGAFRF
jgi:hypothetical protein